MNRKIATLAIALTATIGALAVSVDSASARGGHGGGFGRGGGFGGYHHRRHWGGYGWAYGGYAGSCFYNPWGRLICYY